MGSNRSDVCQCGFWIDGTLEGSLAAQLADYADDPVVLVPGEPGRRELASISPAALKSTACRELQESERQERAYRGQKPIPAFAGR